MGRSEIRSSGMERRSCVMAADPKPFRSNPPERHTLQRKLFSTSFFLSHPPPFTALNLAGLLFSTSGSY